MSVNSLKKNLNYICSSYITNQARQGTSVHVKPYFFHSPDDKESKDSSGGQLQQKDITLSGGDLQTHLEAMVSHIFGLIFDQKQHTESESNRAMLKQITKELGNHWSKIYALADAVQTSKNAIGLFLQSLKALAANRTSAEEQSYVTYHQFNEIVVSAQCMLDSFQASICRQSETLKTDFATLNQAVLDYFDVTRQEILPVKAHTLNTSDFKEPKNCKQGKTTQIELQQEYEHQKEENKRLSFEHIKEKEQFNQEKECMITDHVQQMSQRQQDIRHLQQEHKSLRVDHELFMTQTQQEIDRLKQVLLNTSREYDKLVAEMKTKITILEAECENLKAMHLRFKRPVQLYFEGKGELILNIVDGFKSMLVQHMGIQRRELKLIYCPSVNDVDPDLPLMVLCINVSRIGTDVQRTLCHLNASNRVALLILHHKDVHALPSQASDRVLTGVDFQSLGGIFDLAFLADKGFYQCDMNSIAAEGLVNFITR